MKQPDRCDRCNKQLPSFTIEDEYGELVCQACDQAQEEASWDRQQERDLESPPESAREEQLRTWNEHQKAHKR